MVLKILITVLILLFPLGELGRINIYNEVSTTVNDAFVGLVVFVWLVRMILKNKLYETSKIRLAKPILFFISLAFLSLLFNYNSISLPEVIISFLYLLRFISYAGIYFIVSGFDLKFKRKILALLLTSGSLIVLGGFVQYFLYPDLRNLYYLGWDEHLYRLFGTFLDPNFTASIISLYLILVLSILLSGFNGYFKTRRSGMFLALLSMFAFVALLLTYSRSGYLMFLTSISALLLILGRKRYIVILFLLFIVGIILIPKNLEGEGVKLLRTASIISRSENLNNAITIFREHPILGVGLNSYRYAQHRYGFIDDYSLSTSHAASGADNSFLFVFVTTGAVGFALYFYMWFKILKTSQGTLKRSSNNRFYRTVSCVIIASSVGIFVNAFFINSLFYPFVMEWMWVLVGLNENTATDPSPPAGGSE